MKIRQAWCVTCDGTVLCDEHGCVACRIEKQERARAVHANGPIALSGFCAICIDGTEDLRPVQLDERGPVYTVCKHCDEDGAEKSRGYHGIRTPRGPYTRGWVHV